MSKFATLKDLSKDKPDPSKKQREDYVGGGASGLNVVNPGKDGKPADGDVVDRIVRRAAEESTSGAPAEGSNPLTLTFYKTGFTIDDSDLRRYDDPANATFLADVEKGQLPRELVPLLKERARRTGEDIEAGINVVNKKEEDYVPPAYRAFSGSGAALGKAASAPKTAIVSGSGGAAVVVDDSQPTTTLQIRLADGRREKIVLNLSHTIADLQKHVASLKGTSKPFVLSAGFPPKSLGDPSLTLEAAGLKAAAITQKEA